MNEDDICYNRYVKSFDSNYEKAEIVFTDKNVCKMFVNELKNCDKCDIATTEIHNKSDGGATLEIHSGCNILKKDLLRKKLNKRINIKKFIIIEKKPQTVEESGKYVELINEMNGM
jgi:hypothetical protein